MERKFISAKNESVRMFTSPVLDFFSRVHWSTPLIFWVPIVSYCLYFTSSAGIPVSKIGILFACGFGSWTLAEYLLHRFVFHYHPSSAWGKRVHFLMHGVHHDYPNDEKRLVMPPLLSAPLAAVFFALFYGLFGLYFGSDVFAGLITGYLLYDMMHYALHHANFNSPMFRELKEHHMIHHFHDPEHGFGVSSKMWDYVFKTTFNIEKKNVVVEGK